MYVNNDTKICKTDKQIYMHWPFAATHVYQSAEEKSL